MWESRMEIIVGKKRTAAKFKETYSQCVHHQPIITSSNAMWISLLNKLVVISTIKVVVGITRPPCCTGVFSRNNNHHGHHWQRGLQEAVYHSLTQHSAFDGSLDERVERDRRLWKRVRAAEFNEDLSIINGIQSGILMNKDHHLEFHPLNYNCRSRECTKMILAIWDIQRTDHPKGYHITVKLPVSQSYIEDSYEYTSMEGLKHLGVQNKHKHYTYQYTIGSDGKHNLKMDNRPVQKPIKFPTWNKHKTIYDINKKQSNNQDDKSEEDSDEDESDDRVIKIEPRRRFQYRDSLRPKKQGLIVAFVPQNPQKEFEIPDDKYDGFIPISQESLRQQNNHRTYKRTSHEEHDERHLKEYKELIRKYINERQRQKPPPDFRPSKPYIQYSEPDPLYIEQSYTPQTVPKPTIDQNKFLIVQKYPDSINSHVTGGYTTGAVPTIPYISVTVSNKIPVQNFNQIDLPTTQKTIEPTQTSTISVSNTNNSTINDVELITLNSNSSVITTKLPPKFSTTPRIETSIEELTTAITTSQQTMILTRANNDLDESSEDSKLITGSGSTLNRNIIKKDTRRNNENYESSTTNNETPTVSVTETSNKIEVTTEITTGDTNEENRSIQPQNIRENTANSNDAVTEIIFNTNTPTTIISVPTMLLLDQQNLTQQSEVSMTENSTQMRSSKSNARLNISSSVITNQTQVMPTTTIKTVTHSLTDSEDQSTTMLSTLPPTITTSITEGTTDPSIDTTSNYLDEARNHLADLFASLTYDLFNPQRFPPQFQSESSNEETSSYPQILMINSTETTDYTNYDEYLNEETTEASIQNRRYLNYNSSVEKKSNRNLSKIFSLRQRSNSH